MDTGPKQRRQMNPRYGANLFSILTFGYVGDGARKSQNTENIYLYTFLLDGPTPGGPITV